LVEQDKTALQALMKPMPSKLLEGWPMSKAVNNPRMDGPELMVR
jgi:putative SOS response-associated peptidase YedK